MRMQVESRNYDSYFCTSSMSQVIRPIDLKSQVVVCMDHLVSHGVLQMSLILHFVGAEENPEFRIESTCLSTRAATAVDIMAVKVASELANVITEEADDGTCTDRN